jgi:hypothetical protein
LSIFGGVVLLRLGDNIDFPREPVPVLCPSDDLLKPISSVGSSSGALASSNLTSLIALNNDLWNKMSFFMEICQQKNTCIN